MTTGKFISQLDACIKKVESLAQSLQGSSFHPSKDQYQTLGHLCLRLTAAATNLPKQIEALKNRRTELSSKEGKTFVVQAESERRDLVTTTKLKNRGTFAKNITLFFEGQRDSVVDSTATKARKQVTRERCERICSLSPDGLISWAVAFMATTWTANLMSKDTFGYVVEHIEPDDALVWPPDIYRILRGLAAEEPLKGHPKYHEFLEVVEDDIGKAQGTNPPSKRRRILDGTALEESVRTSESQLASRGSTGPNEATETLANNQIAEDGKARQSQASRTIADDKTVPKQASANRKTNTYDGDLFIVDIVDARQALSHAEQVWEIWLTNPESKYNANDAKKRSFLTLWISEALGKELGKRSKPMVVNGTSDKEVQSTNNENADACPHG